jgi:hypothetical protein
MMLHATGNVVCMGCFQASRALSFENGKCCKVLMIISDQHFCFQSECVELGSNIFTAGEIKQQEKVILQHLQWQMRPVTPYEFMHHIVLYDARMEKTLQHSILHQSQIVIDFSLCGLCPHLCVKHGIVVTSFPSPDVLPGVFCQNILS